MGPLLLIGAALGGAAMYFFDPAKGRRRRALVHDQAVKATTDARHFVDRGRRDLVNRGAAATGRLRSAFRWRRTTDSVLVERVRSRMGHHVTHPGAIDVTVAEGQVTLAGAILAAEHDNLIEQVSRVPGVRDIFDRLDVHETAEGIPSLQGGRELHSERRAAVQERWSPGTRLLSGAAGTTLTLYALTRRHRFAGLLALATGAALLARTTTNMPLRRLAGRDGYRAIDVQKTVQVEVPVSKAFAFLANYENFPRFMRNVLSVEIYPDGRSHWKVAGPAGTHVEWDAITTRTEPDRVIEWSTVAGGTVEHAGAIRFQPSNGGTRIDIDMSYNPPAGALGHAVAMLFGADPDSELDEDLRRLKQVLESGGQDPRSTGADNPAVSA